MISEVASIFTADIISGICVLVLLVGMIIRGDRNRAPQKLKNVAVTIILWVAVDALSYVINGPEYPGVLVFIINLLAYTLGNISMIFFIIYCQAVMNEKEKVNPWFFNIPIVINIITILDIIVEICMGRIFIALDGYTYATGKSPVLFVWVQILLMVYFPILYFIHRKRIGIKAAIIFTSYTVLPLIALIIKKFTRAGDYTATSVAMALMIVYALLQNEKAHEMEQITIKLLADQRDELEGKQLKLEDLACEQEAQIEEIRALNDMLESRASIIQSMSKVYFVSYFVNVVEDTFEEIRNVDFVSQYIGSRGNAQASLFLMSEKMVKKDNSAELHDFVDFSTLNERMRGKTFITCDYEGNVAGWCQLYIIEGDRDENGDLISVFVAARTIHDEKAREDAHNRELIKAKVAAEEANQAKTIFLNNMSHDIRTPMNAILGYAELMKNNTNNPVIIDDYLKKLYSSGEYLLTIINNVLDMARIESGNVKIEEQYYNFGDNSKNASFLFDDLIRKKKLKFEIERDIKHSSVYVDLTKTQQITVNLLSNAIKYTPEGGTIRQTLREVPCEKEGYATYITTISDNGIGMSPEFKEHVFDNFSRERNTTESKIIGTGLGMSIVKNLVELMGGTIEVDSKLGEGTTFTVTLTHRIAEDQEEYISKNTVSEDDLGTLKGKRILLAEDNELNAEIAITILEEKGFVVEHAEDGVICVDMINKASDGYYDMVLMDIQMPNMNGYEATKIIRAMDSEVKKNIPIVAMTANAFDEDKRMAMESGMNGHMAKPIKVDLLIKTMYDLLK